MASVRDLIHAAQKEMRQGNVAPVRLCDLLNTLTALIGNVNDELREAELDYKRVLLSYRQTSKSAVEARMFAETQDEYGRYREAKDTKELALEMVYTLKTVSKATQEEMKLNGY
jgi:DNA-binding protein H-NS